MKEANNKNFPIIKIGGWRFLALLVLLIGIATTYFYVSLQFVSNRNTLLSQNNLLAMSIEQPQPKKPLKRKNLSKVNDKPFFVLKKSATDIHWKVPESLVLTLDDNKTSIVFALGDSSAIGKSYDLSVPMQELFSKGGDYYQFEGILQFQPRLLVYSTHPLENPPFQNIFLSSKSILIPFIEFITGILISLFLFFYITFKSKHVRSNFNAQKQTYFSLLEEALANVDFKSLMELLADSPGVYNNFRKYGLEINKARNEAKAYQESLEIQIKKMVELIAPLTEGKWEMTIDVPPGMLTPIADSINLIAEKAKSIIPADISAGESKHTTEVKNAEIPPAIPEIEKVLPEQIEKPPGSFGSWKSAISDSSQNIEYLSKQLKLIAQVVPPIFIQIEKLYETELNNKLVSENKYNPVSLKSLERLISEKNTIMLTLQNLNKITNELLMLHNWVSIKFANAAGEYSPPAN